MNEFHLIHEYQKLVREHGDEEKILLCTCGETLIPALRGGELALWCPFDGTYLFPGLRMMDNIRDAIAGYYRRKR
jgi:hypothetical protein